MRFSRMPLRLLETERFPLRKVRQPQDVYRCRALELHAQPGADRTACLKDDRVMDGIPVLPPVAVLVLGQERASRPVRLLVVDVVALAVDGAQRREIRLEVGDALGIE